MKPRELLASVTTADGELSLYRHDRDFTIQLDGYDLMLSRMHGSEDALAELAIEMVAKSGPLEVLVGGLGMGFTARAALDAVAGRHGSRVTVAEIFDSIVEWNRSWLGPLADQPLEDPRTRLRMGDVATLVTEAESRWDAILLDVDNGPDAFTLADNHRLYDASGRRRLYDALTPGGVVAFWSAYPSPDFVEQLRRTGFESRAETVSARRIGKGGRHVIFLGRRPPRRRRGG